MINAFLLNGIHEAEDTAAITSRVTFAENAGDAASVPQEIAAVYVRGSRSDNLDFDFLRNNSLI